MNRAMQFALCVFTLVCPTVGIAQVDNASSPLPVPPQDSTSPAAFLYVEGTPFSSSANGIIAYSVGANGQLTAVPASPFHFSSAPEGVNGKYLFGMESNGTTIDSFLMKSNGALQKVDSINTATFNPGAASCGVLGKFRVDHSGHSLYNSVLDPTCTYQQTGPTRLQEFQINNANGKLIYSGETPANEGGTDDVVLLGNDLFGFATSDFSFDNDSSCGIERYRRTSNGALNDLGTSFLGPNGTLGPFPKDSLDFYCPVMLATDPANHLAAIFYGTGNEPWVIGTYTADSNGHLSTTSTYQNMPVINVGSQLYSMRMSPSGKLLAIGTGNGLEVFHFNGGNQVTFYKKLLSGKNVIQCVWDNNNHLFALVSGTSPFGQLHEYTVTPTSFVEVSGSPFAVSHPKAMAIQPR